MKEAKVLSINIVSHAQKSYISSIELFDSILPNSDNYYTKWLRMNITDQPQKLPKEGRDYIFCLSIKGYKRAERTRGRKREDLLLSIPFARELCYQTKTLPAEEVREFLYGFIDK